MNPMIRFRTSSLAALLIVLSPGCATVAGTAVSPITGGVDLTRYHVDSGGSRLWVPFVFIGGAVGGPFAALWNGIAHDLSMGHLSPYWRDFPEIFRPFEMIDRNGAG
jgi:hypothetical protein